MTPEAPNGRSLLTILGAGSATAAVLFANASEGADKKTPPKAAPKKPDKPQEPDKLPGQIELSAVPAAIKDAASRAVKNTKWTSAAKHKDDGEETYELFGKDDKERDVSVEIASDAKVTSVERSIDPKNIAKAAADAIAKRMPAFKPEHALELFGGDDIRDLTKAELAYQLNGTAAKGKELTVEITPEGKFVEVRREIDAAEVTQTVTEALTKRAPKFKPDIIHRITREDKVVGYLFAGKRGWIAFVSNDGKEIQIHKDE